MISWLIVAIIIVSGIILIKMNHFRHRIFLIIMILIVVSLYGTFSLVNYTNTLNLDSTEGFINAGKIYMGWMANAFHNLKSLTTNAIKMDWISINKTTIENIENKKIMDKIKRDK